LSSLWLEVYEGLASRGLWLAGPWGDRLVVSGRDRTQFLQNFTTNDVSRLTMDGVVEAFFLNAKGHVISHTLIAGREPTLLVYTLGNSAEELAAHLNPYILREDVALSVDQSPWWLTLGGKLGEHAADASHPDHKIGLHLAEVEAEINPCPLFNCPAWIVESRVSQERLELAFEQAGYSRPGGEVVARVVYDALRIEAGIPVSGVDYLPGTLPQELDRNTTAIDFRKGCYLGQETVARIDALGRVNRLLRGIQFEQDNYPYPGIALESGGRQVATATSLTYSPSLGTSLGMAMVRREAAVPGTALSWSNGKAATIQFPRRVFE
jgi:tRNA-modifying protein YgfZ